MPNRVTEVLDDVYLIDCIFAGLPGQCGVFLIQGEVTVLVDAGPSVNTPDVTAGLASLGLKVSDIDYIVLTHFHLDHAGAVSALLEGNVKATVLVDGESTGFLTEPARLVRSAHRSLGEVAPHYGTMAGIEADRLVALRDGDELDLGGGKILKALHTPGHSNGHFSFWEPSSRALLCGDALGHFIQAGAYVYPATPAPEFDPDISLATATRLAELAPDILLFSHFGFSTDVQSIIRQFQSQVGRFLRIASELPEAERDAVSLAAILLRDFPTLHPEEADLVRGIMRVNAAGLLHYLRISGS